MDHKFVVVARYNIRFLHESLKSLRHHYPNDPIIILFPPDYPCSLKSKLEVLASGYNIPLYKSTYANRIITAISICDSKYVTIFDESILPTTKFVDITVFDNNKISICGYIVAYSNGNIRNSGTLLIGNRMLPVTNVLSSGTIPAVNCKVITICTDRLTKCSLSLLKSDREPYGIFSDLCFCLDEWANGNRIYLIGDMISAIDVDPNQNYDYHSILYQEQFVLFKQNYFSKFRIAQGHSKIATQQGYVKHASKTVVINTTPELTCFFKNILRSRLTGDTTQINLNLSDNLIRYYPFIQRCVKNRMFISEFSFCDDLEIPVERSNNLIRHSTAPAQSILTVEKEDKYVSQLNDLSRAAENYNLVGMCLDSEDSFTDCEFVLTFMSNRYSAPQNKIALLIDPAYIGSDMCSHITTSYNNLSIHPIYEDFCLWPHLAEMCEVFIWTDKSSSFILSGLATPCVINPPFSNKFSEEEFKRCGL